MCKVELKGPAARGAAAPFRYIYTVTHTHTHTHLLRHTFLMGTITDTYHMKSFYPQSIVTPM